MKAALNRALRTFLQAVLGAIASSGVLATIVSTGTIDVSVLQSVGIIALFAGLSALISYVQNALENNDTIPKLLR